MKKALFCSISVGAVFSVLIAGAVFAENKGKRLRSCYMFNVPHQKLASLTGHAFSDIIIEKEKKNENS